MAFYNAMQLKSNGKWYPQAVQVDQPFTTKELADALAEISTVSYADVMAVLGELPGVMADYMAQGKSVRLDGFGTFRYTLDTEGVADEAQFDAQKQIKSVRVQFTPTREGNTKTGEAVTRALVPTGIEWLEYGGTEDTAADDAEDPGTGEDTGSDGSFG